MNAEQFNAIYDNVVGSALVARGFEKHRSAYYLEVDEAVFALLRFGRKADSLLQTTNILACIRHRFLRGLTDLAVPEVARADINDYPFKERPLGLTIGTVGQWRYRPINLGVRVGDFDSIEYGSVSASEDVLPVLCGIVECVVSGGVALLERLPPQEALRELKTNGENAWCERIWIEDYEGFLARAV